ncbi:ABC transporter permease subunit [Clostridium pasteurianum]|uniref:ABC transporter permease n=1 Tax=Clostridium pasteurianum TaxID=1501 RepID=UPI002260A1DC|nr:ABC transporter permease subunit [Clostridium pasteurianum]UZW15280.1 ABC transporter permease subunit [Clostridium pasteurianum]
MCRMIHAEIYKLFRTRTFKVLCIVAVILAIISIGTSKIMSSEDFFRSSLKGMPKNQQDQYIEQLQKINNPSDSKVVIGNIGMRNPSKDIFHPTARELFYGSFGSGVIEILLSVLIASIVAGEYSSGTIKNMLAYGKRREYYYISKLIAISIGFVIILGIMVTVTTVGSTILYGWGVPFDINQALQLLKIFIAASIVGLGIISFIMLLSTLIKSNGITIILGVVIFSLLPTIISFLYGKYTWFDKIYESTLPYNWALVTSVHAVNSDILKAIAVGIITLLLTLSAGIFVLKSQDIK